MKQRKYIGRVMLFAVFVGMQFGVAAQAQQSPWPMFRHDARHTGHTPYTGPPTPTEAWTFAANDGIVSSPTIGADGTIYFGASWHFFGALDPHMYALNPDGSLKWAYEAGDGFFSSPALGPDNVIYASCLDGNLYAIEDLGASATDKWIAPIGGVFALASPIVGADGTVYVGSVDFWFYAFHPDNGALKWSWYTDWCIISSAAIGDDGLIYVGSKDHNLYAFDDAMEAPAWQFPAGTFYDGHLVDSSPAIADDGTIYFGTDPYGAAGQDPIVVDTNFWAVNPDGTLKWSFDTDDGVESSPAIGPDGTVYFGSYDGHLYAVTDEGTHGSLKWKFPTGGAIDGSPTVDGDGIIYFGSRDSNIYALYPDGSVRWTFPTLDGIECSPTIDDRGYLYIGSFDGNLYAIGTGGPDVGVAALELPTEVMAEGYYVPAAVVRNYRSASQQFEVACVIETDSTVVFDKTEPVTVAGGENVVQSFGLWQVGPGIGVEYNVTVTTTLVGDENDYNDEHTAQLVSVAEPGGAGDCNEDGAVTLADWSVVAACLEGPDVWYAGGCACADADVDADVDLADFAHLQAAFEPGG